AAEFRRVARAEIPAMGLPVAGRLLAGDEVRDLTAQALAFGWQGGRGKAEGGHAGIVAVPSEGVKSRRPGSRGPGNRDLRRVRNFSPWHGVALAPISCRSGIGG